jgi:hypothetical protein
VSYALDHTLRVILTVSPVVIVAWSGARILVPQRDFPTRMTVSLLIGFITVCTSGGVLGILGALSFRGYLLILWPLAAGALFLWRRLRSQNVDASASARPSWPIVVTGVVATLVTAGALARKLVDGIPGYDELTYHLFFPTQWIADRKISIIDTPFGDAAPAYAPANGELWYTWLMAPMAGSVPIAPSLDSLLHSGVGVIAKVGQFPFLFLLGLSLTVLARRLAGSRSMMYLPAVLLPFIPNVLQQTSSATVDLMMGSLVVAALAFILEYRATGDRTDAIAAGTALGLAGGVKFLALINSPFVLLPALMAFSRRRDAKAAIAFAVAAAVVGSPWYLRNMFLTGNPIFPADVSLFGRVIFPGAYTRQAMTASEFHVSGFSSIVEVAVRSVGFWFSLVGIGGMIAGFALGRRRPEWRSLAWVAPCALVWHFLVVPYNSQSRFLIWVGALTLLPLSLWPDTGTGRRWLGAILAGLVGVSLIGPRVSFQIGRVRVPAGGLVDGQMRTPMKFVRRLNRMGPADLQLAGYVRVLEMRPKAVAYSGRNIPYLLAGIEGRTRVRYVNVDGRTDKHLHDYIEEEARSGALDKTMEKQEWTRRHPDFDAWLGALRSMGIDLLFVEPTFGDEVRYLAHDASFFLIERRWAQQHPETFALVAADRKWELYSVLPRR